MKRLLKPFAIFVFGFIFPFFVLFQAYVSTSTLRDNIIYTTKLGDLPQYVNNAHSAFWSANDYALFSLLYVEHANQKTMINKQIMKTVIIHIGFSVISVGMMLIILGIEEKVEQSKADESQQNKVEESLRGFKTEASVGEYKFNLQTGSTGVGVFIVGAIVATLGGVLKNDYQTSQIPNFESSDNQVDMESYNKSIEAYKACNRELNSVELCFTQVFFQINQEKLK